MMEMLRKHRGKIVIPIPVTTCYNKFDTCQIGVSSVRVVPQAYTIHPANDGIGYCRIDRLFLCHALQQPILSYYHVTHVE